MTVRCRSPRGIAAHAGDGSPLTHRRLLAAAATVVALCSLVAVGTARAAETTKLTVGFAPYRLGANSAFTFVVQVGSTTGAAPSPATSIGLRMPAGMGLSTSQLGLSVCRPAALQAGGVAGCPAEAVIGTGSASVVEAMGSEQIQIPAAITVVMAPSVHEQTRLFFYAEAQSVVLAELLFAGYMTGIAKPLGTLVDAGIPPTAGVPGTPPAALIRLAVTLAPRGLMYVKRVNGRTVRYHPEGLAVPTACPPGGFPFGVKLGFADGTSTEATTRLACPTAVGHSGARRHGRAREHSRQGRRGK
jgi:hypothetical protein